MKLIVAGSRSISDYKLIKHCIDCVSSECHIPITEIVSGTARGVDCLGEQYAKDNNISIKHFPADWEKYKKSAGYIRNEAMAKYADALLAIWDGNSKGTQHMINLANKHKLKYIWTVKL